MLGAALAALLLANAGLGIAHWFQINAHTAAQDELDLRQRDVQRLEGQLSRATTSVDLAKQLPSQIDAGSVLRRLQRLAVENNVTLVSVSVSKDTPNKEISGLRRAAWDAQLSGSYPVIKTMLMQLLEQSPELWLARLHLNASANGVEAQITLQAWSFDTSPQPQRSEVAR